MPDITDEHYKKNLIQRALMKKSSVRDTIFMSHMTKEKDNIGGKFFNDDEHRAYKFRYFKEVERKLKSEIAETTSQAPPASND